MSDPRHLFDLTGRVACVTGASSGLGQRAAIVLAAAGARVVGVARRADALAEWAAQTGPNAATVAADLSQRDQITDIATRIATPFGAPDIVVHAAGINTRERADYIDYCKSRNQARWECRKAKKEFEHELAKESKTNPKAFYSYVNSKLKTRSGIANLDTETGKVTTDKDKAEALNNFFVSVFTNENTELNPTTPSTTSETPLQPLEITEEDV